MSRKYPGQPFPVEKQSADGIKLKLLTRSGGYVMIRKPRAFPTVMAEADWLKLEDWQKPVNAE